MKIILFSYFDTVLHLSCVKSYCVSESKVDDFISSKRKFLEREFKEGLFVNLRIEIVDKLDFTMMLL